jgi:hypothetical protein
MVVARAGVSQHVLATLGSFAQRAAVLALSLMNW